MNRGTLASAVSSRRVRIAASSTLALAVLIGGTLYLGLGMSSSDAASAGKATSSPTAPSECATASAVSCASSPAPLEVAAAPVVVTMPPVRTSASPRPTKTAPSPSASSASSPMTSPTASATVDQDGAPAAQVLALINQARATAGLPALTITSGLETTSSAHNLLMADGCGLSHQCPGEPAIGQRETNAGIDWTAAGENIGEGGPVADTTAAIASMAVGLTQSMLNEQPPNDGHRLNILSTSYTHIGIAVYRDSSGTVWLTQDFSN
jgi:uncharacterized protein YkwD